MISWRKGLATSEVINRRTFFHSLFILVIYFHKTQFTSSRDSKRTRLEHPARRRSTACMAFKALVLVFRCGNIRGIDVFVG